jgi:hypothetical protein
MLLYFFFKRSSDCSAWVVHAQCRLVASAVQWAVQCHSAAAVGRSAQGALCPVQRSADSAGYPLVVTISEKSVMQPLRGVTTGQGEPRAVVKAAVR